MDVDNFAQYIFCHISCSAVNVLKYDVSEKLHIMGQIELTPKCMMARKCIFRLNV